jgi:hypothetical protein
VGSLDVNTAQVKQGMAWMYRQYNRDKSLLALEQEAKNAKHGLWSEPNAIPPWEYRHGSRAGPQQEANQHKPWPRQKQAAATHAALSGILVRTQKFFGGPVKIRGFCFTLACDDGSERRGLRTG